MMIIIHRLQTADIFLKWFMTDGWKEMIRNPPCLSFWQPSREEKNTSPDALRSQRGEKTGELADVENDAGSLYYSDNDLVIVFMSENLSQAGAARKHHCIPQSADIRLLSAIKAVSWNQTFKKETAQAD